MKYSDAFVWENKERIKMNFKGNRHDYIVFRK